MFSLKLFNCFKFLSAKQCGAKAFCGLGADIHVTDICTCVLSVKKQTPADLLAGLFVVIGLRPASVIRKQTC